MHEYCQGFLCRFGTIRVIVLFPSKYPFQFKLLLPSSAFRFFCHLDLELMQFLQMDKNLATKQLHEHGGKDFGILDEILYAILCNIWL